MGEQEDRLRKYAEAHGWIIGSCYMDAGFSGANMNRAGLQSLIDDVTQHKVNKVLAYKLDRLSRSQKDTLYLIEDVFLKNGVDFVSMSETLDTSTPFGMAMIGILSVFAQLERETIKERMKIGRDASISSGNYKGIQKEAPIGFKADENGKIAPDEYEQELIRRVYDLYLQGNSMRKISQIMQSSAPIRNANWEVERVKRILDNPIYIGKQRWNGEVYDCKDIAPTVSMDTWNAVQRKREKLSEGKNYKPRNSTHTSMLGGLIKCGICGRRYSGVTSNDGRGHSYRYYRCSGNHHFLNAEGKCPAHHIPIDSLDDLIISEIKKLSAERSIITDKDTQTEANKKRAAAINKRIQTIAAQQRKLIDLYALDSIDRAALIERSEQLTEERKKLEMELNTLTSQPNSTTSTFINDLNTFDTIIQNSPDQQSLYNIIHSLITTIEITGDNIKINWSL